MKKSADHSSAVEGDVRRALDAVRQVVQALRIASRDAEKRVGLSSAQLFVLQKLAEEKTLSVNELAARTHTHQSSVSVVVQRLVERRMVSRSRSKADARQIELSVTAAGRAVLRSAPRATQDQLIAAMHRMPPAKLHQLANSLQHLSDLLGMDDTAPAPMFFEDTAHSAPARKSARAAQRPRRKARDNVRS